MSAKETDQRETYPSTFLETDGTSLKAGLDVVRKFGVALESELPWDGCSSTERRPRPSTSPRAPAPDHGLLQPRRRQRARPPPLPEWRHWLHAERTRCSCWSSRTGTSQTTAGDLDGFDEASVAGSHAAALFGYGPDHFLLRSSWGTDWGDAGYARMSLEYAAQA